MRMFPISISTQLVIILVAGLLMMSCFGVTIQFYDRGKILYRTGVIQAAQHFTSIIHLFEILPSEDRIKISSAMETPIRYIRFPGSDEIIEESKHDHFGNAGHLHHLLNLYLGEDRQIRVWAINVGFNEELYIQKKEIGTKQSPTLENIKKLRAEHQRHELDEARGFFPHGLSYVAQVRLKDDSWIEFHNHLPDEWFSWPTGPLAAIVVWFLLVSAVSLWAVHRVTRHLLVLSDAADELSPDFQKKPLPVKGPKEVQRVIQVFNEMQSRLSRFLQERTHLLAALSHDLKTPITRLRLWTEMHENKNHREKLLKDLREMEEMAAMALDYIRGMERMEPFDLVDLSAMLDLLIEEFSELGKQVEVIHGSLPPTLVMPQSLKRCLANFIHNAITYGEVAKVTSHVEKKEIILTISDQGPGIPENEIERIFEPFVRLEKSRNRNTGGTGLGLGIARNIIQAHEGEIRLRNRSAGGLEVLLKLPIKKRNRHYTK